MWPDALHQVAYIEAESLGDFQMQVTLEDWREKERVLAPGEDHGVQGFAEPRKVYPDSILRGQEDCIAWCHRNPVSPWKSTLELQRLDPAIERSTDPLLHRTFGGLIWGDGLTRVNDLTLKTLVTGRRFRISFHTHTMTPATEAEWLAATEKLASAVNAIGIEQSRQAHRRWWDQFWNRSWIRATGTSAAEAVTRGYVLQRFLAAGAGRGHYPIKFNGSIFTVNTEFDPDYRRWGGGYWFQNTRLPYWPMLASGDFDLMRPLFSMYERTLPLARLRTRVYFHHEGCFFPETMSFWGTYENGDLGWGWRKGGKPGDRLSNSYIRFHYNGSLELLAMMLDYYDYTEDKAFLDEELLPMADELLLWWDKHWPRDAAGKLKMSPSNALETYWDVTNPAQDVAGLRWDTERLLALSDEEIGAARRTHWTALRRAVPALPTMNRSGRKTLAPAELPLPRRTNLENPELYAVFPFRIYGFGKPNLPLALDTFGARLQRGNSGWAQDDTQAALLGLATTARDLVAGRAQQKNAGSRFPAFWGPNYDWIPDQDHGSNLLMALQTMLLQADGGKICVLPAWPRDWDVDFRLHAPLATVVEGKVRKGRLVECQVSPAERRKNLVVRPDTPAR